ncbi:MAG TPA: glycosyltransferase family 39 protein [Elusimicrobiota bacterium]|nr:glycosyltransferase family 39 protein [Elusimicrobiota bacterium]
MIHETSPKIRPELKGLFFPSGPVFDGAAVILALVSFGMSWVETLVNQDSHHWGFMYSQALDLNRGLVPYKDVLIAYGVLTSRIQGFFLTVMGERLVSIGAATGLFYSTTLLLSYAVFRKFLTKPFALFSVLLVFLVHPYVIYPWSNYYAYPFELAALLVLLGGFRSSVGGFFSGVLVGLAVLCRFSAAVSLVPPFVLFFAVDYAVRREQRNEILTTALFWSAGLFLPLAVFWGFLAHHRAVGEFLRQNSVMSREWREMGSFRLFLRFCWNVLSARTLPVRDVRSWLFYAVFIGNLVTVFHFLKKRGSVKDGSSGEGSLLLFSLAAVFGFMNSIHIYEVFRLVNGASLGIGVLVWVVFSAYPGFGKRGKWLAWWSSIAVVCLLAGNLVFARNSSTFTPWTWEKMTGSGTARIQTGVFRGKRVSRAYREFYGDIATRLSAVDRSCPIVNVTADPLPVLLCDLPRLQRTPLYVHQMERPERLDEVRRLIGLRRVVLAGYFPLEVPGYRLLYGAPWPEDVPWFDDEGLALFISVPEWALPPEPPS